MLDPRRSQPHYLIEISLGSLLVYYQRGSERKGRSREGGVGRLEGASCIANSPKFLSTFIDAAFHYKATNCPRLSFCIHNINAVLQNSRKQGGGGGLDWAGQADTHPWHPYFFRCNVDSRSFVSTDVAPKSLSTNYNIEFYLSLRCTVISQDNAVTTALRMRAVCYSFIRSSSYFLYHFFLLPPRCSHSPLPSAVFFFQCLLITCPFYLFCYVFPVVNPFNKIPRVHL